MGGCEILVMVGVTGQVLGVDRGDKGRWILYADDIFNGEWSAVLFTSHSSMYYLTETQSL